MNSSEYTRRSFLRAAGAAGLLATPLAAIVSRGCSSQTKPARPNIVLVMTDDQGWAQTGYYNHPALKTPNLDAMAANGLRFDRFYAGGPVCSPTRATVLTGRTHDRAGVPSHGHALRLQEKTIAQALKTIGYATGHFGKWHLNGLRGPGAPVLHDDTHGPGAFGFDRWFSVTNFFDMNPLMSDMGTFIDRAGDSSAVIVDEALSFMRNKTAENTPFFVVLWDGSPHAPWVASEADRAAFSGLNEDSRHHYGELVAFDRSIGALRKGLRDMGVANNTLVWFCSDNGGLPKITPSSVGKLRGFKGSLYEGGLRVPGIIEWPARIKQRITDYPASTMDVFPTIVSILDLPREVMLDPVDGVSLEPLFDAGLTQRSKPIAFRYRGRGALVDNKYKLLMTNIDTQTCALYDLSADPSETTDISVSEPELLEVMKSRFNQWNASVDDSVQGKDYAEGRLVGAHPESRFWMDDPRYEPYLKEWKKRPEYEKRVRLK